MKDVEIFEGKGSVKMKIDVGKSRFYADLGKEGVETLEEEIKRFKKKSMLFEVEE